MNNEYPILILVRGLPGSGKSHVADALGRQLGENVVLLDPDATDYESDEYLKHCENLKTEGVDPKLFAYRFLRAQAYQGIVDHKTIIWNQPFTNIDIFNKMVGRLKDQAAAYNAKLPILVVEVELDHKLAKDRVEKRKQAGGHGPSEDTLERFIADYRSFADDGYTTVTVQGSDEVQESVATIKNALQDLLKS